MCPPERPRSGVSIPKIHALCAGNLTMAASLWGDTGGHTGTAPTVPFRWIARGRLMSFGQVARGMGDFVWVDCAWVVLFVCWENGAHEPTPSVLYFCQPRVADDRRLPWGKAAGGNLCHRHCTF